MRSLGILVEDIKASYDIVKEMKRMRVPFVLLDPNEPIPEFVGAVISFHASGDKGTKQVIYNGNARRTVLRALCVSNPLKVSRNELFDFVVIGIDPGRRTGIAILADGELIEAYTVSEDELEREIAKILEDYPTHSIVFRIGKGIVPEKVILQIKKDDRAKVEFVHEAKMVLPTKYKIKGLPKDARSALIIALSGAVGRSS
ncbi:MAG: hypothetical protein H5T34_00915 [Candidatus Methanomethyliales bacterium]|nr:hypothetical protein [Candidatus Methanomethylicales archaeon]